MDIPYLQQAQTDDEGNFLTGPDGEVLHKDLKDVEPMIADFEANDENTIKVSEDVLLFVKSWRESDGTQFYLYEVSARTPEGVIQLRNKGTDLSALLSQVIPVVHNLESWVESFKKAYEKF